MQISEQISAELWLKSIIAWVTYNPQMHEQEKEEQYGLEQEMRECEGMCELEQPSWEENWRSERI